jgi:predicted nucleic acid-binding protein
VAGELRRAGTSVPLTDVAIAVAATVAEAELWTRDQDFERIRTALPALELHRP